MRRILTAVTASTLLVGGLVLAGQAPAAHAAAPGPKDTTAVLFSYTWNQIAEECETTLGPAGYGYVQTSPPQEHVQGPQWWTYYQPVSYKLESRMGTEEEFRSMVQRCDDAGVGVIVDAVINHMSGQSAGGTGWAGTRYQHYDYPGLYSSNDFHSCRRDIKDYQNRWEVQECNLVNLSDLNTGSPYVQQTIADYLNRLADMGVAGFRIDAVKHIAAEDMKGIWNRVDKRDELYMVQEVIRANEPIQPEEYTGNGDVHEFGFARKLKEAFGGSRIDWLISGAGIGETWDGFLPQEDAAVFVDNHDTERNGETLSYKDGKAYDLAQTFTLAWPYGSPSVHSGYEFSDKDAGPAVDGQGKVIDPAPGQNGWTFKHAQNDIQNMVGFRVATYGTAVTDKWSSSDGSAIAFGRGDKGFVAINNGGGQVERTFTTSLPDGEYYNVIEATRDGERWSGETVTVSGGTFTATLAGKSALALHVGAKAGPVPENPENPETPETPDASATSVYYKAPSGWSSANMHYRVGSGSWTEVPGVRMSAVDGADGWYELDVEAAAGEQITAAFTDGSGAWDNNGGRDYTISSGGDRSVAGGSVTEGAPLQSAGELSLFYKPASGWRAANAHYQVGQGAWTDVPGVAMASVDSCDAGEGWYRLQIGTGGASSVRIAFNDASGVWDNNGGSDYRVTTATAAVSNGKVTTTDPCGVRAE